MVNVPTLVLANLAAESVIASSVFKERDKVCFKFQVGKIQKILARRKD
jgi:hypothetical protein